MWLQLMRWLRAQERRVAGALGAAAAVAAQMALALWQVVRGPLILALNILAALLLIFEEWGWRPLSNLLARLARFRIWALAELWLAGLPPYGSLAALAVPSLIIIPTKLVGVYLLATGHFLTATTIIICAKLVGTALVARIFILTKPSLMQIGWFARAYNAFVPWQESLFAWIRSSSVWRYGRVVNWRAKNYLRSGWSRARPRLVTIWAQLKPRMVVLTRHLRRSAKETPARVEQAWAQFKPKALAGIEQLRQETEEARARAQMAWAKLRPKALALMRQLDLRARDARVRASIAGKRILKQIQGPQS